MKNDSHLFCRPLIGYLLPSKFEYFQYFFVFVGELRNADCNLFRKVSICFSDPRSHDNRKINFFENTYLPWGKAFLSKHVISPFYICQHSAFRCRWNLKTNYNFESKESGKHERVGSSCAKIVHLRTRSVSDCDWFRRGDDRAVA